MFITKSKFEKKVTAEVLKLTAQYRQEIRELSILNEDLQSENLSLKIQASKYKEMFDSKRDSKGRFTKKQKYEVNP